MDLIYIMLIGFALCRFEILIRKMHGGPSSQGYSPRFSPCLMKSKMCSFQGEFAEPGRSIRVRAYGDDWLSLSLVSNIYFVP